MINIEKLHNLVSRVQDGDKESFWEIYDILLEPIYNFIFFKVAHKEIAEDLTEETFIKVWDNIKKFKMQENVPFSAWVYRIAWNLTLDYFRKYNRETFIDPEFDIEDLSPSQTIKEEAEITYNQQILAKALQELHQDQRDVIILKYVNDLSYLEVSIILDKPEWTIRQLHSRAIQKLKVIIEEHFKE